MSAIAPDAGSTKIGYEVANALGRLNSDRPLLGARCTEAVPIARAVRFMLQALDLHQQQTGHSTERIARDIRRGRIELRLDGNRAKVITP
jgi:hypothetical protein